LTDNIDNAAHKESLLSIFSVFFRIGLFTFGGGMAMAVVMRHELVLKKRWLSEEDFVTKFSSAALIPGAVAVNMAYLQGRYFAGIPGAAAAVAGTVLPSFAIILFIAVFGQPWFAHPRVAAFLKGCALAVAGQLMFTSLVFARKQKKRALNVLVCFIGFALVGLLQFHPLWTVFTTGVLGYFLYGISDRDNEITIHNNPEKE
jgi:chromate transporter